MANQYNPMQFGSALSRISGASGGPGLVWEGTQKGLVNRALQKYLKASAEGTAKAGTGMGVLDMLGKGASLLTMMYAPWELPMRLLAGGAVGGAISGIGGKQYAEQLSKEDVAEYMPEGQQPLYGLEQVAEAESTAHSAIDALQSSVVPRALSTAITTPLMYMTMQNLKPIVGGAGGPEALTSIGKDQSLLGGQQALANWLNPNAYDYSTVGENFAALNRQGLGRFFQSRFTGNVPGFGG